MQSTLVTTVTPVNAQHVQRRPAAVTIVSVSDDNAGFIARLKEAMAARGLTQGKLETKAGLSDGYLSRVLDGQRPNISMPTVRALARALAARVDWLVSGDGTMDQETGPELFFEAIARYPNAHEASTMARKMGVRMDAIRDVMGAYAMDDDQPIATWLAAMTARADVLRRDDLEPARLEKQRTLDQAKAEDAKKHAPKWGKR